MVNCFEKLFSTILNERLKVWSIENDKSSNAHFVLNKMISAESMEELLVKRKTWKSEMEKKGLRVNTEKTKILASGMDLDLLKKSGKEPYGVCQKGVGSNAILCGGCLCWIHKKFNDIKSPLRPDPDFRCDRCLGTARPIDGRTVKEVKVDDEKLEAVPEFCYLGDMLGRAVVASWMM